jgi:hypothetical protein
MNMKNKRIKRFGILIVVCSLCLLFAACDGEPVAKLADTSFVFGTGPQAWIDAPLNGDHLPFAPYQVVFHVTDPSQIVNGELQINGEVAALLANPEPEKKLATLRYPWEPKEPGEYLLEVRGQNAGGEWSPVDTAIVFIGEIEAEPSPTPTLEEPEEEEAAAIWDVSARPGEVSYGICSPTEVTVSARAYDPSGITVLVIFYRFRDQSGNATDWLDAAMNPQGGDLYSRTISISSAVDALGFAGKGGTLEYQLIIQNKASEMIRGEVQKNVRVNACEGYILRPLKMQGTPTPTPIIIK